MPAPLGARTEDPDGRHYRVSGIGLAPREARRVGPVAAGAPLPPLRPFFPSAPPCLTDWRARSSGRSPPPTTGARRAPASRQNPRDVAELAAHRAAPTRPGAGPPSGAGNANRYLGLPWSGSRSCASADVSPSTGTPALASATCSPEFPRPPADPCPSSRKASANAPPPPAARTAGPDDPGVGGLADMEPVNGMRGLRT